MDETPYARSERRLGDDRAAATLTDRTRPASSPTMEMTAARW
jgi:hypothetical protein